MEQHDTNIVTDTVTQQNVNDLLVKYYGEGFSDGYLRDPLLVSWINRMNSCDIQLYALPNRTCAAKKVVNIMVDIITAMSRKDKEAGELLLFIMVVMNKKPGFDKNAQVCELINQRVELWVRQMIEQLVQSAEKYSSIEVKRKEKKQRELDAMEKEQREHKETEQFTKIVKRLMQDGNMRQAGKLVMQKASETRRLTADDEIEVDGEHLTVRQVLKSLRSPIRMPCPESLVECDFNNLPPMPIREVSAATIANRLKGMDGSAGPSGCNVQFWKDACRHNGKSSERLRQAVADYSSLLHNEYVSPGLIQALGDCRAVTIDRGPDKKPRPLQIAEVLTRISIGEAVQHHKSEVVKAVGPDQLGVGVRSGVEALVHAIDETLQDDGAALSVDVVNAYGTCCKYAGIVNARVELPQLATLLFNFGRLKERVILKGRSVTYYDEGGGGSLTGTSGCISSIRIGNASIDGHHKSRGSQSEMVRRRRTWISKRAEKASSVEGYLEQA